MGNTPEEMTRKFEEQARVQQAQHNMLQTQEEFINDLKKMIALLLGKQIRKPKSSKTGASSNKNKGKEEGENCTSEHSDGNENNFGYENPESSSEEPENSEAESNNAKRMSELEKRLEAIANRSELQEVGVVRTYPVEWDVAPYPPKFKAPILQTFDGKGSSNIYTTSNPKQGM